MTPTQSLIAFAANRAHAIPQPVLDDTARLLADTLAVGAAGAASPEALRVRAMALGWGSDGPCRLIGHGAKVPATSAAYANGFSVHCLEWDAVHEPAVVHAMSVVTAAVLASADRTPGTPVQALLEAVAIGVDIASGIGLVCTSKVSFFRPATAGIMGAALAVARLEGLDEGQMADVLGLAYSQAAGTMQAHVEGSVALPMQVAGAARGAITAVDAVKAGLTGPHDVLEGQFGYYTLMERGALSDYTDTLGKVWRISEISIKPYPSGRASHAVLGKLETLCAYGAISADDVFGITAHVPPLIHRLVGRAARPDMSAAHARLCLPFLSALMLRDGVIDPRKFTPATFADPALLRVAQTVEVKLDDNADVNALSPQRLVISTPDGRQEHAIPNTLGSPLAPLSEDQAARRMALARDAGGDAAQAGLFDDPIGWILSGA